MNEYTLLIGHKSLIWAAQNGQSEVIKLLLEYGADVNSKDGKSYNTIFLYFFLKQTVQRFF